MNEDKSNVSPKDIEEILAELKEEADEIGGPSLLSRRFLAAGSMPVSYTHLTLPTICSV